MRGAKRVGGGSQVAPRGRGEWLGWRSWFYAAPTELDGYNGGHCYKHGVPTELMDGRLLRHAPGQFSRRRDEQ